MEKGKITCPYCQKTFEISEVIYQDIEADLKAQYDKKMQDILNDKLQEKDKEFAGLKERFAKSEEKLRQEFELREKEFKEKALEEKKAIEEKLKQEIEEAQKAKMEFLEKQLVESKKQLLEQQQKEIGFLKEKQQLEADKQNMELDFMRKLDEAKKKMSEEITSTAEEKYRLIIAEKDKELKDVKVQVDELKRKTEQKSQQFQGDVLETVLEDMLKDQFPFDVIEPVKTGQRGADVIQTVKTQTGKECGKILWEAKRTKIWSDGWIQKLKDDQRQIRADIAVLVSEVLPRGLHQFRNIKDVWVSDIPSALSLGLALRTSLIQLAKAKEAQEGKEEKMEVLYGYLTGSEFRNRVQAIMEAFVGLKNDIDAEKRAMEKSWAKREKQIQRVVTNLAGMQGDIEGIAGVLPAMKILELPGANEVDE